MSEIILSISNLWANGTSIQAIFLAFSGQKELWNYSTPLKIGYFMEEVILVAKPEIILVAKYSGGKTSLNILLPRLRIINYTCAVEKKK